MRWQNILFIWTVACFFMAAACLLTVVAVAVVPVLGDPAARYRNVWNCGSKLSWPLPKPRP